MPKIIITESQLKLLFSEQETYPYKEIPGTTTYDPSGGIGQGLTPKFSYDEITGKKDAIKLRTEKSKPKPKLHDSTCNDQQKQYCKSKGLIATNETKKGKEWDIFSGAKKQGDQYATWGWGHDDNKDYTKCMCREGNVSVYETEVFDPTIGKTIKLKNTRFQEIETIGGKPKWSHSEMRDLDYLWDENLRQWISDNKHEIMDVLAVAALFIPVPGLNIALSMAIEGANAASYFEEDDQISGWLSIISMAVPGAGPIMRRLTQKSLKKIYKIFQQGRRLKTQGATKEEVAEYFAKQKKSLSPEENKFLDELLKPSNVDKIKEFNGKSRKEIKTLFDTKFGQEEWYKQYKNYYSGWGKNSKFFIENLNPTKLEKYIYASAILGGIVLDKTGSIEEISAYVYGKLVEYGFIPNDIPTEQKEIVINDIKQTFADYSHFDPQTLSSEERSKMELKFVDDLDKKVEFYDTLYKYDLPDGMTEKLLFLDKNKKKQFVQKTKENNIPKEKLRDFNNYKWVQACASNNKLTIKKEVTPELQEFLDSDFNPRQIQNKTLGSNYIYSSDEEGFWYYKKGVNDTWKLVTDCMALFKIETEMEKEIDKDIDTEGELYDLMKQFFQDDVKYDDIKN